MESDTSLGVVTRGAPFSVLAQKSFTLQANQMLRVFGRAEVASSVGKIIYLETYAQCKGPDGTVQQGGAAQNHEGSGHPAGPNYPVKGHLALYPLLLFEAPTTGTCTCELTAGSWDDGLSAVATDSRGSSATWLQVSAPIAADAGNDFGASWWQNLECDAAGDYGAASWCLYLAGASELQQLYVFDNDGSPSRSWEAPGSTAFVDASASLMLTTCHYGTSSCTADNSQSFWSYYFWDGPSGTMVDTHLELIQLNAAQGACKITQSPEERSWVGNDPHHYMIYHSLSAVPIYPECGSRRFKLRISVKYVVGNPIKIDGWKWTHAYAFESFSGTAPPVPNLIGLTEGAARARLVASGYAVADVSDSLSVAPAGTVIAQDPSTVQLCPGACLQLPMIELPDSGVNFTVSGGGVMLPNVLGFLQSRATGVISELGLVPTVSYSKACINPGEVLAQSPFSGTLVGPGSTVHLTVDSGTRQTCILK